MTKMGPFWKHPQPPFPTDKVFGKSPKFESTVHSHYLSESHFTKNTDITSLNIFYPSHPVRTLCMCQGSPEKSDQENM